MKISDSKLLNANSVCSPQPEKIIVALKMHQKTAIHRMMNIEKGLIDVYYETKQQKLNSNVGIVSDLVGAGKSLTVLGLISLHNPNEIKGIWNSRCSGVYLEPYLHLNKSLIIVPDNVVHQWAQYLQDQTSFSFSIYQKDIDELDVINDKSEILLIGGKLAKTVLRYNLMFDRLVIDEIDQFMGSQKNDISIKAQYINLMAKFFWMITATPQNLFRNKPSIQKITSVVQSNISKSEKVFDYLEFPTNIFANLPPYLIVDNLIVKNQDSFVKSSMALSDPIFIKIECFQPKAFQICVNFMPALSTALNGHDLAKVAKLLGCTIETPENILSKIENETDWSLISIQSHIKAQTDLLENYPKPEKIAYLKEDIANAIEREGKLKIRLESIRKNIAELRTGCCNICYYEFSENNRKDNPPTFLHCCRNLICTLCISEIKCNQDSCPYCRAKPLNFSISTDTLPKLEEVALQLDKIATLLKLLKETVNGKFLIFASTDSSFNEIIRNLGHNGYVYHILKKDATNVEEQINDFNGSKVNILLMNATVHAAGLNLQSATHIIIFHRLDQYTREQVIGRGQRMGRTSTLKVIELTYGIE